MRTLSTSCYCKDRNKLVKIQLRNPRKNTLPTTEETTPLLPSKVYVSLPLKSFLILNVMTGLTLSRKGRPSSQESPGLCPSKSISISQSNQVRTCKGLSYQNSATDEDVQAMHKVEAFRLEFCWDKRKGTAGITYFLSKPVHYVPCSLYLTFGDCCKYFVCTVFQRYVFGWGWKAKIVM